MALVSFGVYQCPNCGRVDADGNPLAPPPQASVVIDDPAMAPRGSFAPPPPSPSTSFSAASVTVPTRASNELPTVFLATLAALVLVDAGSALASHSVLGAVFQIATAVPLFTGKPWARTLAMAGAVLLIGLCGMGIAVLHGLPGNVRIALAVVILTNAWWLYVLLRPDTVAYFSRR